MSTNKLCAVLQIVISYLFTFSCASLFSNLDSLVNRQLVSAEIEEPGRFCKYRSYEPYPEYHFQLVTGWSCYRYSHPKWITSGEVLKTYSGVLQNLTQYKVPYVVDNGVGVLFDYEDPKYTKIITGLYVEKKYYNKWLSCAQNAMDCCRNLDQNDLGPSDAYPCPALWDGYTCFEKAQSNTNVSKRCPLYLTSNDKFVCNLESVKECNSEGWNHITDYAPCSSSFRYRDRHTFHVIVLAIATSFMLPSLIIYLAYNKLKMWRIVMHRNLIFAIFIKNILVLISKNAIIIDALTIKQEDSVMEADGIWCRVLTFFENLTKNLIFTCMTADAYYAHKSIVRAFSREINVYILYAAIAVASTTPTIVWSIFMGVSGTGKCWVSDSNGYQWITDGYKYACLSVNVILLLDIVRVLFMKYRKGPGKNTGKAIKATIIMLCLFGLPLLISSQRKLFNMDSCLTSDIYTYVTYCIEAFQGIFMTLFFCYMNPDVLQELKRSYRHVKLHVMKRRETLNEVVRRRTTLITYTHNVQESTKV